MTIVNNYTISPVIWMRTGDVNVMYYTWEKEYIDSILRGKKHPHKIFYKK